MWRKIKLLFLVWKTGQCRHNCFKCEYVNDCIRELLEGDS